MSDKLYIAVLTGCTDYYGPHGVTHLCVPADLDLQKVKEAYRERDTFYDGGLCEFMLETYPGVTEWDVDVRRDDDIAYTKGGKTE